MKIKQIPSDFVVEEIYDLEEIAKKDEGRGNIYYYFKLTKIDYTQIKALETVARIFNVSSKQIHFAGTKDKVGITSQLISVYGSKSGNFEKNMEFFNEKFEDLKLEFIGRFNSRLNLGDNLGNRFIITIRDLEDKEIESARNKVAEIDKNGVLNFFDSQRFGYANNSHIVGKYILLNRVSDAVFTILTSLPQNPAENHLEFVNLVKENFDKILVSDVEIIDRAIEVAPKFLRDERFMLEHLKKYKNDCPGALRKIHKKLRTMYVNAYQSYIFNETIKELESQGKIDDYDKLELVSFDSEFDELIGGIVIGMLEKDGLSFESFKLPSSPELRPLKAFRDTRVQVKGLEIEDVEDDDLNEKKKKVVVKFELEKGAYATNVVKGLFL